MRGELLLRWVVTTLMVWEVTSVSTVEVIKPLVTALRKQQLQLGVTPLGVILKNDTFTSSSKISGLCLSHLSHYIVQLTQSAPWALQMMDATTKLPDGLLYGNINQLGNFDECLAVRVYDAPGTTPSFQGGYYRAAITLGGLSSFNTLLQNISSSFLADGGEDPSLPPITWALCLPSSCRPEDVAEIVQTYVPVLVESVFNFKLNISAKVNARDCHVNGDGFVFFTGDWFVLGVMALLLVLVIGSTVLDYVKRERYPLFLAFSARATATQLFNTSPEPGTLGCLHGLRVFSIFWVIMGHRYSITLKGQVSNAAKVIEKFEDVSMMTILNAELSVETFFFLSGLLMCYGFLREMERGKKFDLFKFYLYRYLRLAVPMIVVILWYISFLSHLGDGPLWAIAESQRNVCSTHWWTNVLYVNNYVEFPYGCMGQTWYLSVDMQLAWLSPLVLLPLYHSPRAGLQLMSLLIAISCFLPFTLTYINNYFWSTDAKDTKDLTYFQYMYIPTHVRATPYLCGILLGKYLHTSKGKTLSLSKIRVFKGWCFSTCVCLAVIYTLSIAYQPWYVYNKLDASFYAGFHRLGWSCGIAWIILACVKGYGGPVNSILSWHLLQPLSKLTYGAYLIHFSVLIYDVSVSRTAAYFSHFNVVHTFLGDLPIVFGISTYLYFTVEGPLMVLLRQAFDKKPIKPISKGTD